MAQSSYGLENQVVVVTGGTRGIGFEIAGMLLAEGARVVICARKPDDLESAAAELNGGENLLTIPAHIAKADDVERLFTEAVERFGQVDGLVNNVGMNMLTQVVDGDPALWQKIIDTNLNGTYLCARRAGQIMKTRRQGKIVTISSTAAHRATAGLGVYGIAKAALEMLTRVLAQELAADNVQVNAVAPCMVRTKFSQPLWGNEEMHARIVQAIPLGRIAEPADIAHPVLFLLSRGADFITGQTLMADGGLSAV